jgi:hypothetical protein
MTEKRDNFEAMLLDLHLGQLSPEQEAELRQEIASSPELTEQSEKLGQLLGVLDADEAPVPPPDLSHHVMNHIAASGKILPFEQSKSVLPAGKGQDLSANPVLTLRELIAIAACITLFLGIFVPGYRKAQNVAQRNLCRNNLRAISAGYQAYAAENDSFLPYVGYVPNGSWLATRTPQVKRYSNTKPMFQLVKQKYIDRDNTKVFVCPSVPDGRAMKADDFDDFDDFAEPANVSYSSLLMNQPEGRRLDKMNRRMVLVADRNPLFDQRVTAHRISPYEVGNSLVHEDGAGQNAVFVDGRDDWFTEPTIGVDNDNIYRIGDRTLYSGTETPASESDTMLVP